jgi:hypothetical protein
MIETYQVFSYLHNMMRKDDFAIKLCKDFLEKNPLCWVKVGSEYFATDENGRDYACITNVDGKFLIKEGYHFDATFSPELKLDYENLSDAIENANEILFNVGFSVMLDSSLTRKDDGTDHHASYHEVCLTKDDSQDEDHTEDDLYKDCTCEDCTNPRKLILRPL